MAIAEDQPMPSDRPSGTAYSRNAFAAAGTLDREMMHHDEAEALDAATPKR
jgi:hypothetical protein